MNGKLTNKAISFISLIGTLLGLYQTVQAVKIQQRYNIIASIIFMLAFVLVFIFFHRSKKKYVDLYEICNSMSLNNRLQSLREMILIQYRRSNDNDNKYKITDAKFHYTLSQSKTDNNAYDLHYLISFKLYKTWFMRKCTRDRTLRFFAITLSAAPQNFKSEIISEITTKGKIPIDSRIECVKKNYTTRGESGSREKEYSGLYEIIAVIPQDIAKKKKIEINFSYDVLGQVKKEQDKHSFTIIPRNYSTKINQFEVRVQTKNIPINNLELQRYGIGGEFEIAELFIPHESTNDLFEYYVSVKPNMDSAYSIQFDLPEQDEIDKRFLLKDIKFLGLKTQRKIKTF